jgi:hypothetical protein
MVPAFRIKRLSTKNFKILDIFIKVAQHGDMVNKIKGRDSAARRATISFSHDIYNSLEQIAASKKVSVAWVVRDTDEFYIHPQGGKENSLDIKRDAESA